jgi:hypothetical protein
VQPPRAAEFQRHQCEQQTTYSKFLKKEKIVPQQFFNLLRNVTGKLINNCKFDVHVTVHRRHSEGKEPTR